MDSEVSNQSSQMHMLIRVLAGLAYNFVGFSMSWLTLNTSEVREMIQTNHPISDSEVTASSVLPRMGFGASPETEEKTDRNKKVNKYRNYIYRKDPKFSDR